MECLEKKSNMHHHSEQRVHILGNYIVNSTQRSSFGTGRILISTSGFLGEREVKGALIQIVSNKHIFKVLLITTSPLPWY